MASRALFSCIMSLSCFMNLTLIASAPVARADDKKNISVTDDSRASVYDELRQKSVALAKKVELGIQTLSLTTFIRLEKQPDPRGRSVLCSMRQKVASIISVLEHPCSPDTLHQALTSLNEISTGLVSRIRSRTVLTQPFSTDTTSDKPCARRSDLSFEAMLALYNLAHLSVDEAIAAVEQYSYGSLTSLWASFVKMVQAVHLDTIAARSPKYLVLFCYWIAIRPKDTFAGYHRVPWFKRILKLKRRRPEPKNILSHLKRIIGGIERTEERDATIEKKPMFYGPFGALFRESNGIFTLDTKTPLLALSIPTLVLPGIKRDVQDLSAWIRSKIGHAIAVPESQINDAQVLDAQTARVFFIKMFTALSLEPSEQDLATCIKAAQGRMLREMQTMIEKVIQNCTQNGEAVTVAHIKTALGALT